MLITKPEETRPRGSLLLGFIYSSGWGGVSAYLSLVGRKRDGRLFEAGRLLTFSAFRMDGRLF